MNDTAPAATAVRAVLGAIVRHLLGIIGTTLVARGYVDQDTASSASGPIADYVLGALIAIGALGWGAFHAWLTHTRFYMAWISPARPIPKA